MGGGTLVSQVPEMTGIVVPFAVTLSQLVITMAPYMVLILKAFVVFRWCKFDQPAQEQIVNIPPFQHSNISHGLCSLHTPPSIIFPFIFLLTSPL